MHWQVHESYRTVRACSSIGVPETMAAGTGMSSSLPSWIRFGTGVKVLDDRLTESSYPISDI